MKGRRGRAAGRRVAQGCLEKPFIRILARYSIYCTGSHVHIFDINYTPTSLYYWCWSCCCCIIIISSKKDMDRSFEADAEAEGAATGPP